MTITFLVAINLDDLSTLADVAADIEDALAGSFNVESVKPWARPSVTPASSPLAALPSLVEPPSPTQTQTSTNLNT